MWCEVPWFGREVGSMTQEIGDNIKRYRRAEGLSQEELAEKAGLSVSTVQKAEQGRGAVRTQTLHTIARGLGVTTSALFVAGPPEPVVGDDATKQSLVAIRAALMPPIGIDGVLVASVPKVGDLSALRRRVLAIHDLYRVDDYDAVARALPHLLREAEASVAQADGESARRKAERVWTMTLLVSGKYLTQVRQYDLAYAALSEAIRRAGGAGDRTIAATGVVGLCWLLLRQDRFGDCYDLAVRTAEAMEPRFSEVDPTRVSLWGELWMRAAAAAVRDNRRTEAAEARRMVARASAGMVKEEGEGTFPSVWGSFGPVTARIKAIEDCLVQGHSRADARAVLRQADRGVLRSEARKRTGNPSGASWGRHLLDVAQAHTLLGAHQDAMETLVVIKADRGEWIKHQPMARRMMADILHNRKRGLTAEMRDMAAHLGVVG